jgi:protein NRD1
MSAGANPGVPPAVPAYGFNFPGMPAMPFLPPGYMMGNAQTPPSQPPPPGQGN